MTIPRFKVILAIFIVCICVKLAEADTKVLRQIRVLGLNSLRDETISLENDKDLVVKGVLVQILPLSKDYILKSITDYVADKNGYRAKYRLERMKYNPNTRLSITSLKSLAG